MKIESTIIGHDIYFFYKQKFINEEETDTINAIAAALNNLK